MSSASNPVLSRRALISATAGIGIISLGSHENWIAELEKMRQTVGVRLVGCGHGLPATAGAISDKIAYLKMQNAVLGREKDAQSAVNALTSQFPNYDGLSVLRFVDTHYKG